MYTEQLTIELIHTKLRKELQEQKYEEKMGTKQKH